MFEDRDAEERVCAIVGLGNPGRLYRNTRHNAGFQVLDRLAQSLSVSVSNRESTFVWGRGNVGEEPVFLVKPMTYMNRSGMAIEEFLLDHDIPGDQIFVIHDDVDLPLGKLRIARKGGAGGHRGVASIIEHLRHHSFPRVKVGIGRPRYGESMEDFVLSAPYSDEERLYEETILWAEEAVRMVLETSLTKAMNHVNGRKLEALKIA